MISKHDNELAPEESLNEEEQFLEEGCDESCEECSYEKLQERVAELEAQLQDVTLRAAAAEQNLRRRHQEELRGAYKYASAQFIQSILPVKDCLEMAALDNSGQFDVMKTGVMMVLDQFNKVFLEQKVEEIVANPGDKLDPHKHQAVRTEPSDKYEAGAIIQVYTKGYILQDRVLRPTSVVVAEASSPDTEEVAEEL